MIDITIHGDFYEEILKIQQSTVDMIITDLPYDITHNAWDVRIDLGLMWDLFRHVLKDTGVTVLTAGQPFTSRLVHSNISEFRHEWIWQKENGSNFANTVREPMKEHESILVFSKGQWTYNPIPEERIGSRKGRVTKGSTGTKSENYRDFGKCEPTIHGPLRGPKSIQRFNRDRGLHPTQKPVKLFEYLIKTYSNEKDTVLDCCAGSGTTAIACLNTKRSFIVIEKEQKYYDIIKTRLLDYDSGCKK